MARRIKLTKRFTQLRDDVHAAEAASSAGGQPLVLDPRSSARVE